MRKKIIVILTFFLLFSFSGCAKLVSTEVTVEQVEVKKVDFTPMWFQAIPTGKTVIVINHPPIYEVVVIYNGVDLSLDNEEAYYKCKNIVGKKVTASIKTKKYDNGKIKYSILKIKEVLE